MCRGSGIPDGGSVGSMAFGLEPSASVSIEARRYHKSSTPTSANWIAIVPQTVS